MQIIMLRKNLLDKIIIPEVLKKYMLQRNRLRLLTNAQIVGKSDIGKNKSEPRRIAGTLAFEQNCHEHENAFDLLAGLPDDMFPDGRKDDPPQVRKA